MHDIFRKEFSMKGDDVKCNLRLLLFVGGLPNQGKTTLTNTLTTLRNPRFLSMKGDILLLDYINMLYQAGLFYEEGNLYNLSDQYNKLKKQRKKFAGFLQFVADATRKKIEQNTADVIIIDFAMFTPEIQAKVHRDVDPDLDMLQITVNGGAVHHNGKLVVHAAMQYLLFAGLALLRSRWIR